MGSGRQYLALWNSESGESRIIRKMMEKRECRGRKTKHQGFLRLEKPIKVRRTQE